MRAVVSIAEFRAVLKFHHKWFLAAVASLLLVIGPIQAQSIYTQAYTFSTFAGEASGGFTDGIGTEAQFFYPDDAAVDKSGNVYVADTLNHIIRMITPAGVVTTFAGFPNSPGSADGTGKAARFFAPKGIAVDGAGNVYVADTQNSTIRKITPAGVVTTIAGAAGITGTNDNVGTAARFYSPTRLTLDAAGNIFVADSTNSTIRKITPAGVVTTIAGLAGQTGTNDGVGSLARFTYPAGIAMDTNGIIYVADQFNFSIRKLQPSGTNWTVSTIAGLSGAGGSSNGTNSNARFFRPVGLVVAPGTNLFVTDSENCLIRQIVPSGTNWVVSTFAGDLGFYGHRDGTGTNAVFDDPRGITMDASGNLYVTDVYSSCVRLVTSAALASVFAGAADSGGHIDATGNNARFSLPYGVAVDSQGNVYVGDTANDAVRKISPAGLVITLAGPFGSPALFGTNDGTGTDARFHTPKGVAVDRSGNVYVADQDNHTIRQITPAGVVTTIAGAPGVSGTNDGIGSSARFFLPHTVAVDASGIVYVADTDNSTIRKMTRSGTNWTVTTIAGAPTVQGTNDGTNFNATFNFPIGLAVDNATNIYVGDYNTFCVRKITPQGTNWVVTTIAGAPTIQGTNDGTNKAALFTGPFGLAVDAAGSLYVGDGNAATMRKIIHVGTNWVVSTIAGQANNLGSIDGTGSNTLFSFCGQVAVDTNGNVFVADTGNDTIRKGVFTQFQPASVAPSALAVANGSLMVTLQPSAANGQWRFPWELSWHTNGETVSNLVPGNYPVLFRDIPGYLPVPASLIGPDAVAVTAGLKIITNQYYPTLNISGTTNGGNLTVNIGPNLVIGSGWRFLGETGWRAPGSSATGLVPDTYFVEFEPVSGYAKPATLGVQVSAGLSTVITENYLLAQSPPSNVILPVPVPVGNITNLAAFPFGFNGQLQSDTGFGSAVAVQTNVVLATAHEVFNDNALSYVSNAFWFWQQETGVAAPEPLIARGWYLLSGYASQRTNDLLGGLAPDQSSPQSRNLDVAALFFLNYVANGGFGGFLPSDVVPNQWLTSSANKMLVGYPIDGSLFGTNIVPGEMYQTVPQPYPLALDTAPSTTQQEVYTANWFLSFPGNSGGPLYVQLNGYYYPAGVYLGTLYNGVVPYASAVRAIDSNVVNLITLAAVQGLSGTNNGGGPITLVPGAGLSSNPATVSVTLGPPAAVTEGAGWRLATDPTNSFSGNPAYRRPVSTTNAIVFKPIPGFQVPAAQSIQLAAGIVTNITANYTISAPTKLALDKSLNLGLTGTVNTTYRIERATNLVSPKWVGLSTNTITATNFNQVLAKSAFTNSAPAFYRAVWLP